ncbi:hypothetical protein L1D59_20120 [Pseudoalteromonas piscicida]|uniref:hypothetical protein n=1 Tax=Pseudoalteromonas piscicida TaxID=43662 RepID=UPI001EFD1626|nr:hypothetical protein [Pseudoalteromonas piscicida]MCG9770908.1 hypothetical protein [Pseudoalteromonas piscicida]
MSDEERELLAKQIEQDLLHLYGSPILNLNQLQRALNYRSLAAVKQAIQRQTLPVPVFDLPNRRGRYAYVKDVGTFLAEQAFKKED